MVIVTFVLLAKINNKLKTYGTLLFGRLKIWLGGEIRTMTALVNVFAF